ncbi:MAG: hypothetical protein WCP32_09340 [Bacteroidota bacterium]
MRQLFLIITLNVLVLASMAQTTGSARITATIASPDEICSLALNSSDGLQFILQNGAANCFDITLGTSETLTSVENTTQIPSQTRNYSLAKSSSPKTNDILINISPETQSPKEIACVSKQLTISIHYN